MVNSRDGNRPRPVSFAIRMRSSTRAWARCRASRNAELTDAGVGGEGLVAPAVGLFEQGQSGAGMGLLPSDDDSHPGRPLRQVEQSGEFGDLRAVTDLTVGVDRRRPRRFRQRTDGVVDLDSFVDGESDRVLHRPAADLVLFGEPVQHLMRRTGGVGPDQHLDGDGRRGSG